MTHYDTNVTEDTDIAQRIYDIKLERSHSYRNYNPDELEKLYRQADRDQEIEIRNILKQIEGGRFHDLLTQFHRQMSALDQDERKKMATRNPGLTKWQKTYAVIEEVQMYEPLAQD
jgi:hypothetical protein